MKALEIPATYNSPLVSMQPTGEILLQGRFLPEHAKEFFKPIWAWVDEYLESPPVNTNLSLKVEYLNSTSQKVLLDLFERFEQANRDGLTTPKINWHYEEEDEQMFDTGKEYEQIIDLPFEIIEVEEF